MPKVEVSIIIPCKNEEKTIGNVIESILNSTFPREKIEIIIVDGMSTDSSKEIITQYYEKYNFIRLLDNPKQTIPHALNIGIKNAKGEIIIRMDAHSVYPADYIQRSVEYLNKYNVSNVGGVWKIIPGSKTKIASSIAIACSSFFGSGDSLFKIGVNKPQYVDTVPFGCFRKKIFDEIGLFDEDLNRGQDTEFNLRILRKGGKVLLAPDIVSYYCARDNFKKLWIQYFQYGLNKPLVFKKTGGYVRWRQLAPPLFVGLLIVIGVSSFLIHTLIIPFAWLIILYAFINLSWSIFLAIKEKEIAFVIFLPIAFLSIHAPYGLGYLRGIYTHLLEAKVC